MTHLRLVAYSHPRRLGHMYDVFLVFVPHRMTSGMVLRGEAEKLCAAVDAERSAGNCARWKGTPTELHPGYLYLASCNALGPERTMGAHEHGGERRGGCAGRRSQREGEQRERTAGTDSRGQDAVSTLPWPVSALTALFIFGSDAFGGLFTCLGRPIIYIYYILYMYIYDRGPRFGPSLYRGQSQSGVQSVEFAEEKLKQIHGHM